MTIIKQEFIKISDEVENELKKYYNETSVGKYNYKMIKMIMGWVITKSN